MHRLLPALALGALASLVTGCAGTGEPAPTENRVTVTGVVNYAQDGAPRLDDCDSRRAVLLGPMDAGNEHFFRRRVAELATRRNQPVTAEVSGYPERRRGQLVLERPALMGLSSGTCTDPEDFGFADAR